MALAAPHETEAYTEGEEDSSRSITPTSSPTFLTATPPPGVAYLTCSSFFVGGNWCETGYTPVDDATECDPDGCDRATCCEEGTPCACVLGVSPLVRSWMMEVLSRTLSSSRTEFVIKNDEGNSVFDVEKRKL